MFLATIDGSVCAYSFILHYVCIYYCNVNNILFASIIVISRKKLYLKKKKFNHD